VKLIRTVQCSSAVLCPVVGLHGHKHTHMISSYRCTGYWDCWFRILCVLCFSYLSQFAYFVFFDPFGVFSLFFLSCQYQCKGLPAKTRLRNDLLCVMGRKTLLTH